VKNLELEGSKITVEPFTRCNSQIYAQGLLEYFSRFGPVHFL
jgi:hypothetical protein